MDLSQNSSELSMHFQKGIERSLPPRLAWRRKVHPKGQRNSEGTEEEEVDCFTVFEQVY